MWGERSVDFVGGDVKESECGFFWGVELLPVGAGCFEEVESADDVGLDELAWAVDGTVDV